MSPKRGIPVQQSADRSLVVNSEATSYGIISARFYPMDNVTGTTTVIDETWFRPFVVHADMVVEGISIQVTTAQASGLLRIGLYTPNEADGNYPGNLIEDMGTVDASTTGGKLASFSANRDWLAGQLWWFAMQTNDATIGIRGTNEARNGDADTSGAANFAVRTTTAFASGLPDPAASVGFSNSKTPYLMVKAV